MNSRVPAAQRRLGASMRLQMAVVLVSAVVVAGSARAFTVASGFTEGCHERITLRAYLDFAVGLPVADLYVPDTTDDETWREVSAFFNDQFSDLRSVLANPSDVDEADGFLVTSLLIGVRSPDTDGHSTFNLASLRELHSDPAPEGQYAHALRGPDDDYEDGAKAAIAGTRRRIETLFRDARDAALREGPRQLTMGTFYLDFYGRIEIPVSASAFYLGQAAHAVQDSFSHTIRDEAVGFREIVGVLNYVDAIGTRLDESRDGLAHSDSMDDCFGVPGEAGGTVDAAVAATVDLLIAFRIFTSSTDSEVLDRYFDKWFVLRDGCTESDGFCGNDRWLATVRAKQTEPYFEAIFGCGTHGGRPPRTALPLMLATALLVAGARRRGR